MFDILFGWRKASKCKKLIKQVRCRLKLLKNKRCAIAKQLREDIAQLIADGYEKTAFNRVEQVMKDEITMAAYDLLDNFCVFILDNLSYIRRHKECPNDVNEAVSSLMYASARCGDLPELQLIRKLFGERYGHRFEKTAVEFTPGNLVNSQMKEKLSVNPITDDEKHRMIQKIVSDCLQPKLLALEYRSDWHQNQVLPEEVHTYDEITEGPQKPVPSADEINRKEIQDCHMVSDSLSNSEHPKDEKEGKSENCYEVDFPDQLKNKGMTYTVTLERGEGRKNSASSCESLPQLPDEKIVYLDDVVELSSSTTKEGDQSLFKFKSPALPRRESVKDSYDQTDIDRSEYCSEIEDSTSKGSRKSRSGTRKGFVGRRSLRKEMQKTKDIECVSYYGRPVNNSTHKHRSQHQMRPHKNILTPEKDCYWEIKGGSFCRYLPKRSDHGFCLNRKTENYKLECVGKGDEKDSHEGSPRKKTKKWVSPSEEAYSRGEARDKEMECPNFYEKQRRRRGAASSDIRSTSYDVFTYVDDDSDEKNKEITGEDAKSITVESCENLQVSSRTMNGDGMRNKTQTPYLRAVTLPPERPGDSKKGSVTRSNSCPYKNPNHVHPKLPEYEDIAAKFMALKREHQQNKTSKS